MKSFSPLPHVLFGDSELPLPPCSGLAPRPHSLELRPTLGPSPIFALPPHSLTPHVPPPVRVGATLANRYQICSPLGGGAFSEVALAFDAESKTEVAIKILSSPDANDSELAILNSLKNCCPSIVEFKHSFTHQGRQCLVFEALGRSVHSAMKLQRMASDVIRPIARDVFSALACLHTRHIVHCDVKPENVLFVRGSKSRVKLIDFGTSTFVGQPLFEYFQSRYYRAPEVILGLHFDGAVDIWSAGCLLAEMAIGEPLFAGADEEEQLVKFVELLGMPPEYLRKKIEADVGNARRRKRRQLKRRMRDRALVDLIMRCLVWEPTERISAADALKDPFFQVG
jgi:dual specificity tyrosine-phosphorylation-regulated kinase 2/3/4